MFLPSCVVQALSCVNGPAARYTLRHNIASIIEIGLFDFEFFSSSSNDKETKKSGIYFDDHEFTMQEQESTVSHSCVTNALLL